MADARNDKNILFWLFVKIFKRTFNERLWSFLLLLLLTYINMSKKIKDITLIF